MFNVIAVKYQLIGKKKMNVEKNLEIHHFNTKKIGFENNGSKLREWLVVNSNGLMIFLGNCLNSKVCIMRGI